MTVNQIRYFGWKNLHPYYNLNYLKKVITEIEPIDLEKLRKIKSPLMVSLTRPGKKKADFVDLPKAKIQLIFFSLALARRYFQKKMNIDGEVYFDGGFKAHRLSVIRD